MDWYERNVGAFTILAALLAPPLIMVMLFLKPLLHAWLGIEVELGVTP